MPPPSPSGAPSPAGVIMADLKEARVPDIGHEGVPVIEVPAPFAGTVKEVKLKVGDEVSEGAVIAIIEADGQMKTDGEAVTPSPSPAPGEGRGEGAPASAAPAPSPAPA